MKILFIGSVKFSYVLLDELIRAGEDICGVITLSESSFNSDHKDLTPLCRNRIPVLSLKKNDHSKILEFARECEPDVIYCFGWSYLLKKELLEYPEIGVIGYHPTQLPRNRGRHPLIWTLALGLRESASTFFIMGEGADDGDILSQERFDILEADDAGSVYEKLLKIASRQVVEFTEQLKIGTAKPITQEFSTANEWRKRGEKDGLIDFRMSKGAIYNLVRALTHPYIGAHITYKGYNVPVWKVEKINYEKKNIEPGKIIATDGKSITVKCYDGAIKIVDHGFQSSPAVGEYF
ncbi:hypothetical protein M3P05_19090 [Sansalvadorimonas sp. 2012CJ34-2]|uniref:Methionyl-tRNA formyltransferase n=1 Tax=Parendozoicomonas callyspongiae TaxID=2942213 RepID=A0ABT0PL87_9GAMM|nr:formyltransferase family protein [Sansalvadorimonas sp. 2012CJ34-2]MCL6272031.1 hypothetical protein [Sansalvadorimonas sp. 2012CJ34-2]